MFCVFILLTVIDVVVVVVGIVLCLWVPLPLLHIQGGEVTRKVTESVTI
jgi:hypothetical protein